MITYAKLNYMIENQKVVSVSYELYIAGEEAGKEELIERAPAEHPLVYCHGEGMMLPAFEAALAGKNEGDAFDFTIPCDQAYGEYDEDGVMELDKKMFCIDGEFDAERVKVGAVIPMNTSDGQIINAQVAEITADKVTIDLNHPFAGEDLHFIGKIVAIRDVTPAELDAIRNPHCGGGCGGCGGGSCSGCGDGQGCEGGCKN